MTSPDPDHALIVLPQGHWVEYSLPRALKDHAEVEIALYMFNWGEMPHVYETDADQQQRPIFATSYSGTYAPGYYKVLGFDLGDLDIPFEIHGLRIEGRDNAGPYGGCGIG